MNGYTSPQHHLITVILGVMLYGCGGTATASDCWLALYDSPNFSGQVARIEGPAELSNLTKVNGKDWSGLVDSVKTGPTAEVTLYKHENFRTESIDQPNHPDALRAWGNQDENYFEDHFILTPGESVHHLGEVHFHDQVRSLKIRCK